MAQAAEIIILAGQGVVSAVRDVAPAFERASGHKAVVSFEVGPGLMNKVNSDAPADVVTHYPDMIMISPRKEKCSQVLVSSLPALASELLCGR
jgi:ABC-type molybdate transport system substrate-binding protein